VAGTLRLLTRADLESLNLSTLPLLSGVVILSDPADGAPLAVMDGGVITAWRTGAGVGVAVRHLGRPETQTAAVLGCGARARSSVRALAAVLPGLRRVRALFLRRSGDRAGGQGDERRFCLNLGWPPKTS